MAKPKAIEVAIEAKGWDERTGMHAVIVRNDTIRIFGKYSDRPFDKTFKIGDMAEYDSYNLSYFGPIVGITEKTVTIEERYGSEKRRHRLDLYKFAWRNHRFDETETRAQNAETSMYI